MTTTATEAPPNVRDATLDPRMRKIDGGTVTLCPHSILVFTPDDAEQITEAESELDALLGKPKCQGTNRAGNPCEGRAGPDGWCASHKPDPIPPS